MSEELAQSASAVRTIEPEDEKSLSNGIKQSVGVETEFRVISEADNSGVNNAENSTVHKLMSMMFRKEETTAGDEVTEPITNGVENSTVHEIQSPVLEEEETSAGNETEKPLTNEVEPPALNKDETFTENGIEQPVKNEVESSTVPEIEGAVLNEEEKTAENEVESFTEHEIESPVLKKEDTISGNETEKSVTSEMENSMVNEIEPLVLKEKETIHENNIEQPVENETKNPLVNEIKPLVKEETEKLDDDYWTNMSTSHQRTFAPLNVPLYRRRQTLTILVWLLMPWLCLYLSLVLLRCHNWYIVGAFIAYLTWMFAFQKYSREGGLRQDWLRKLEWWKWFADYFPIHLHKTCDLPSDRSYLFGCHPHGIISLGAFCNFATEATGFEEKFPGINLRLLTLKINFRIPFYGLYLSLLGICDASKESCNYILEKGNGNSILLVLGGAKESLDAHPSDEYILTLKNRKGFVKIALANGASLVPVFSFGENDLYDQLANPRGSKLRRIQMKIQQRLGYATPFFKGRGIFQYSFGFLPNRHAINTYVGEPIHLPKLDRDKITPEIVDKYHQEYMEALKRLFDANKAKHGNANATIKYVNDYEW